MTLCEAQRVARVLFSDSAECELAGRSGASGLTITKFARQLAEHVGRHESGKWSRRERSGPIFKGEAVGYRSEGMIEAAKLSCRMGSTQGYALNDHINRVRRSQIQRESQASSISELTNTPRVLFRNQTHERISK